ncbi:MAG: hypothetical protein RI556_10920 [Hydrogenovibrio sp.]|uniref:hypothetical protein n=1 Tax=Hydrogenovibrio sp. TaxID=2065821 RepID=UPI0028706F03|nr:hypothetical protein [Hydrogenovibrio sp.]MDR9499677.1 hypothetical protein [Hydrogenovibrio sp.]
MTTCLSRRRWLGALLWIGFLGLWALISLPSLSLHTHFSGFFPQPSDPAQASKWSALSHLAEASSEPAPLMVSIRLPDSVSAQAAAKLSRHIATPKNHQAWLKSVQNRPQPLSDWLDHPLREQRFLLTDFHPETLTASLETFWQRWQAGFVLNKPLALSDPQNQWLSYLQQGLSTPSLAVDAGVWQTITGETRQLLLLLTVSKDGIDQVQSWLTQAVSRHLSPRQAEKTEVRVSNAAWIAQQAQAGIQQRVQWVSLTALAVIFGFLLAVFGKVRPLLATLLPVTSAVLVGFLAVNAVFAQVSVLTLAFGMVLVGVSMDYPLHLWAAAKRGHVRHARRLVAIGGVTSVLGFAALWWTAVPGIQQIAVFSAAGLVAALITSFLSAPSASNASNPPLIWPARNRKRLALGTLALAGVWGTLQALPTVWQDDLRSMSPVPESLLQQDGQLRSAFHLPEAAAFLLVTADTTEDLLQKQESLQPGLARLQADQALQGRTMLADWLPSQQHQRQRQNALPDASSLQQAWSKADTPFKPHHAQGLIQAIDRSRQMPALTLERFRSLALPWQKVMLNKLYWQAGDRHFGVILVQDAQAEALQSWAQTQSDVLWVQQSTLVSEQLTHLREQLLVGLLALVAAMLLGLSLYWRSFYQAWSLLLPIGLGLGLAWLGLSLLGPVSVFHLMASLLVVAIGVDYSLFLNQAQTDPTQRFSVHVTLTTSLVAFGGLLFTDVALLMSMGLSVVLGLLMTYASARLLFSARPSS